jgi:hypothetical protein
MVRKLRPDPIGFRPKVRFNHSVLKNNTCESRFNNSLKLRNPVPANIDPRHLRLFKVESSNFIFTHSDMMGFDRRTKPPKLRSHLTNHHILDHSDRRPRTPSSHTPIHITLTYSSDGRTKSFDHWRRSILPVTPPSPPIEGVHSRLSNGKKVTSTSDCGHGEFQPQMPLAPTCSIHSRQEPAFIPPLGFLRLDDIDLRHLLHRGWLAQCARSLPHEASRSGA